MDYLRKWWRPFLVASIAFCSFAYAMYWIEYPDAVIFDEVHFGKFTSAYCCTHKRIFDVHPPHAKILIAKFVALFTEPQEEFPFERIDEFYDDFPYVWFRFIPALAGSLLPAMAALLAIQLGLSFPYVFIAGFGLFFENALRLQSNFINIDTLQLLAQMCCLAALLAAFQTKHSWWKFLAYAFTAAIAAGTSVSIKFSGLMVIILPFAAMSYRWFTSAPLSRQFAPSIVKLLITYVLMGILGFAIYAFGFYLHFKLLTLPGPGDLFYVPKGEFFADMINLTKVMFDRSAAITAEHPYASKWWSWPLMLRGIFYWQRDEAVMYLLPNPIVWIGSTVLVLFALSHRLWLSIAKKSDWRAEDFAVLLLLVPMLGSWLPFAPLSRPLFLYHYFTAMIMAWIAGCAWLQRVDAFKGRSWGLVSFYLSMVLIVIAYVLMLPLTAGLDHPEYIKWVFHTIPNWQ